MRRADRLGWTRCAAPPRSTLLYTKADVDKATALIASWKDNGRKCPEGVTDADLWAARDVRDAVVHPDTGEPIPMVFR